MAQVILDQASTVTGNIAANGGGIYNDERANATVTVKGGSAVDQNLAVGTNLAAYWPFENSAARCFRE